MGIEGAPGGGKGVGSGCQQVRSAPVVGSAYLFLGVCSRRLLSRGHVVGDDGLVVDALTEPPANGKPPAKRRVPAKRKGAAAQETAASAPAALPDARVEVKEEAAEAEAGAALPAKRRRGPSKAKLAAEAAAAAAAQVGPCSSLVLRQHSLVMVHVHCAGTRKKDAVHQKSDYQLEHRGKHTGCSYLLSKSNH